MLIAILQDAFFAALAAVGFAAISRPPLRAYPYCALIAAIGHSSRYAMMSPEPGLSLSIIPATFLAALIVGVLAVFLSPVARTPAETCLFPSLLPMIPGMYAYRAFGGLALCLMSSHREVFDSNFFLFASNSMTCMCILIGMVVGATIPIFVFKNVSFTATRDGRRAS